MLARERSTDRSYLLLLSPRWRHVRRDGGRVGGGGCKSAPRVQLDKAQVDLFYFLFSCSGHRHKAVIWEQYDWPRCKCGWGRGLLLRTYLYVWSRHQSPVRTVWAYYSADVIFPETVTTHYQHYRPGDVRHRFLMISLYCKYGLCLSRDEQCVSCRNPISMTHCTMWHLMKQENWNVQGSSQLGWSHTPCEHDKSQMTSAGCGGDCNIWEKIISRLRAR